MAFVEGLTTFLGGVGGTVILLMPGYILSRAIRRGVRGPDQTDLVFVATSAIGGILTHVLWLAWTISIARKTVVAVNEWAAEINRLNEALQKGQQAEVALPDLPFFELGLWMLVVLVLFPAALGSAIAYFAGRFRGGWESAADRIGLTPALRPERAWTWAFKKLYDSGMGAWVRVRIKDEDAVFIGQFGPNSMASADPSNPDIYLERFAVADAEGRPIQGIAPNNQGMWIAGDKILSVEFF